MVKNIKRVFLVFCLFAHVDASAMLIRPLDELVGEFTSGQRLLLGEIKNAPLRNQVDQNSTDASDEGKAEEFDSLKISLPFFDRNLKAYPELLLGEKIFLRPRFPSDHIDFRAVLMDPESMKYYMTGRTFSVEEIERGVLNEAIESHQLLPNNCIWTIITHDGIVGDFSIYAGHDVANNNEIAVGYFLNPAYKGRGIVVMAGELALNQKECKYIALVHPLNSASQHVLKKLGFTRDQNRQHVKKYGAERDYFIRLPIVND